VIEVNGLVPKAFEIQLQPIEESGDELSLIHVKHLFGSEQVLHSE
jgi:hypothetical protein